MENNPVDAVQARNPLLDIGKAIIAFALKCRNARITREDGKSSGMAMKEIIL